MTRNPIPLIAVRYPKPGADRSSIQLQYVKLLLPTTVGYSFAMVEQKGYGQFCPVSRAAEILASRWTPLVVRELLCGSVRFNDLQRGVPRMSSALLSRRLKELQYAGIVEHRPASGGRGLEYHLTDAGRELLPVLEGMGNWAQRWVRDDLSVDENLDPDLLMWDVRRSVTAEGMPRDRRFVVRFWLVFDQGEADLCVKDPGFDIDLYVASHVRTMVKIWLGHEAIAEALRHERLALDGAPKDIRAFRSWFSLSVFAAAGREAPGQASGPPGA
jgi:DNA-binding HxlR family transcriptional regulator